MIHEAEENVPLAVICSRRRTARVETNEGVYALWRCAGLEGLSRVRDLSPRGLFVEAPVEANPGVNVKLEFLADVGQIRASAEVRYASSGQGLGLEFVALHRQDCQHLVSLIQRFGASSRLYNARAAG